MDSMEDRIAYVGCSMNFQGYENTAYRHKEQKQKFDLSEHVSKELHNRLAAAKICTKNMMHNKTFLQQNCYIINTRKQKCLQHTFKISISLANNDSQVVLCEFQA